MQGETVGKIILRFLVNDQLGTHFFSIYLFQFSTCFEQPRAHHQENQLYQYNLWYMPLCIGDRFVCRSESSIPTCTVQNVTESHSARRTIHEQNKDWIEYAATQPNRP